VGYNRTREERRKKRYQLDIEEMISRYDKECGKAVTRDATPEEIEKYNKKLNKHKKG